VNRKATRGRRRCVSWLGATVKPRIAWSRSVKLTAPRQHYGERAAARELFSILNLVLQPIAP
jgi:hypothetical protein